MRALVLSGGAAKGAYQIGVLRRWMLEENTDYQIMCGVSVGSLNVACLAQEPFGSPRKAFERLEAVWLGVNNEKIYRRWVPFGRLSALWKDSLFDSSPLRDLVARELDVERIRNSARQVRVGAVCLETGEKRFGTERDARLADWVVASASFPVFFQPVEIDGKHWFDGGVRNLTPLGQALELGATEIDMIVCSDGQKKEIPAPKRRPIHYQIFRAIDIMSDQILRSDLTVTLLKNELSMYDEKYREVRIRLVEPDSPLVNNSLDFDPAKIREMFERGYADSLRFRVI